MNTKHRNASRAKRDPTALYRVLGRITTFTPAEQADLSLPVRVAYECLKSGKGTESDFHSLAAAVNIALMCAEDIDALVEQTCMDGVAAMQRMHDRHQKTGAWGFDGPALAEVELVIGLYEQMTALLTGGQMRDAMERCMRRMAEQQKEAV